MRKSGIILGILAAASVSAATDRTMNVRIDPLKVISGEIGADADFVVGERFTVGPTVSTLSAKLLVTELSGFNFGARGNWYLSGGAISDSFYLGPTVGYSAMTVKELGAEGSTGSLALGSLIGYQWVWNSGINLNVGAGATYYTNDGTVTAGNQTLKVPFYSGFFPQAELSLGYAF